MTKTDIANIALRALGAGSTPDITGSDSVSVSCLAAFPVAYDDLTQRVTINALVTRQSLVPTPTSPNGLGPNIPVAVDQWRNNYGQSSIPVMLQPLELWTMNYFVPTSPGMLRPLGLDSGMAFYIEGGVLYTNDAAASLIYVTLPDDTYIASLPYYACLAMGYKIAILLAADMMRENMLGLVERLYEEAIAKARAYNGRINNPPKPPRPWGRP